jgi:hypothetical protein
VKYELGFYIPEDDILYSYCQENLKSYNMYQIAVSRFMRYHEIRFGSKIRRQVVT